jgi:diguanylate cyclase (GGDEF)-like protein/PAS domain S-box-containing protein
MAKDREYLLALSRPIFQKLKTEHHITHLYFHDQHRVNILRVHQPNRFGDTIDRYTALNAEKTKILSHGIELGPMGTFTLRAVLPLWQGKRLLGYIELGEEVDQIIQDMGRIFDVDLILFIKKRYLQQADWVSGINMLKRESEWGRLPNNVVISQTSNELLQNVLSNSANFTSLKDIEITHNNQIFQGRIVNLRDRGERNVGGMIVLRNITARIQDTLNTMIMINMSALLLGLLLFYLFYLILSRTEQQLKTLFFGLQESESHLVDAQHMAHLGNWEWDLNQNALHFSDEAGNILGLTTDTLSSDYETLLDRIHPEDKESFKEFIDKVRVNEDIYELTNRIVRPDGTERKVQHHAELICDKSNEKEAYAIKGVIHDITELHNAEIRSARMGRILEHSWNEIYIFNSETLFFSEVSDGACRNLGYSVEEMRKLTPLDLKLEFTPKQFETLIGSLRRNEEQQISFETEHHRKDGSSYPVQLRLQLSRAENPPAFIAIGQDISERKRYIKELEHKALYDTLTDLPNRSLLQDRLKHALTIAHRETSTLVVAMVDVMRLREINDLLGHHNGDLILKEIAIRLQKGFRKSDTVARLGSDEFVVLLPSANLEHARTAAVKIQTLFEEPVIIEDTPLELEAAIGIAHYPEHGDTPEILLQHADIAMCVAKNEVSGLSFYNSDDDHFNVRQLKLHGEIRQAINNKELALYYQPQVDISTGKIKSVETLARWPHPTEGMISPVDFIPMVEQSGMIRPFTFWVLEEAIKQSRKWIEAGIDLTLSVNLSTRNLIDPNLADNIVSLLESHQVSPDRIVLEVTESAIMSRPEYAQKVLQRLHQMGFKLSIDDFGTGYSSLAYLKKLPISELKIDSSFVFGLVENDNDAVIVRSTIELAHNMGLYTVAEGVESKEILDMLSILNCDIAQGYCLSRPLPINELEQWLINSPYGIGN